mgnify:CR=1 FL=1
MVERAIKMEGSVSGAISLCKSRLFFALAFFAVSYLIVAVRIFELTTISEENIQDITIPQMSEHKTKRTNIVDRNGVLLSTNLKTISIYANPQKIINHEEAAKHLINLFPTLSEEKLLAELHSDKNFVWVKRNLSPREFEAVIDVGIPGVYPREEEKRVYPHENLVSHILGFVGLDGNGLSGVEKFYNKKLIADSEKENPLKLSIDVRVQDIMHKELSANMRRFNAIGAAGIIMDANNGEIISMVSLPDFDPNKPDLVKKDHTFNRGTLGVYEMGSIFKAFTIAGAMDEKAISFADMFDATKPIRIGKHTISDYHAKNKWLSVPEVFMHSSNIGMAKIALEWGESKQKKFLEKLNLLEEMKLEIGEKGKPIYPSKWSKASAMTISFGHGMAVTPMHVVAAMAAMVNGGDYYFPTFIKSEEKAEGKKVISKKTSDKMRKLLRLVVAHGTGSFAEAKGYLVGGKTGTAEKLVDGKYDSKSRMSSFMAAFPMHEPKYVILVMLDEPKGDKESFGYATGGYTAAPVVSRVVSKIGPMLGIAPTSDEDPKIIEALEIKGFSEEKKEVAAN